MASILKGRFFRYATPLSLVLGSRAASGLAPALAYPFITTHYPRDVWNAIAIGQSIGMAAAVFADCGWSTFGGSQLRKTQSPRNLVVESVHSKSIALFISLPLVALAALLVGTGSDTSLSFLTALSVASTSLSPVWYWLAQGEFLRLLVLDGLARLVGSLIGLLLLKSGWPIATYPIGNLVVSLLTCVGCYDLKNLDLGRVKLAIQRCRNQLGFAISRTVQASSFALPVYFVAALWPRSLAQFSAHDRIGKLYLAALLPLAQVVQTWSLRRDLTVHSTRILVYRLAGGAGVATAIGFVVSFPFAFNILFGAMQSNDTLVVLMSVTAALVMVNRILQLALLPRIASPKRLGRLVWLSTSAFYLALAACSRAGNEVSVVVAMIAAEMTAVATGMIMMSGKAARQLRISS